jgi:hypothetical protein
MRASQPTAETTRDGMRSRARVMSRAADINPQFATSFKRGLRRALEWRDAAMSRQNLPRYSGEELRRLAGLQKGERTGRMAGAQVRYRVTEETG